MSTQTVDLTSGFRDSLPSSHPADFPVRLRPLRYVGLDGMYINVDGKMAVVRTDTGTPLAVVSEHYTLVLHQALLGAMEGAISGLDVGPVPCGIYVDREGARMRALFKFPALAERLERNDEICPCVQLKNAYDGTSRVMVSIGAFRFVCTNLSVGGGGVFAGGFMAVHKGEIPIEEVAGQLADFLTRFSAIMALYRAWVAMPAEEERLVRALGGIAKRHRMRVLERMPLSSASVFAAYNAATRHATRECRSAPLAFRLLEAVNQGFQREFPEDLELKEDEIAF